MGCDWISAGATCFGYVLSYSDVFTNTRFANMESLQYDSDNDAEGNSEDESKEDDVLENEESSDEKDLSAVKKYQKLGDYSAERMLIKAWYHYLERFHADALIFKIQVFIGCESIPGSYEIEKQTDSCNVVFGFDNTNHTSAKKKDKTIHTLSYEFPNNITSIITGFLTEFQKKSSNSKKKAKLEVCACPTEPLLISFVG